MNYGLNSSQYNSQAKWVTGLPSSAGGSQGIVSLTYSPEHLSGGVQRLKTQQKAGELSSQNIHNVSLGELFHWDKLAHPVSSAVGVQHGYPEEEHIRSVSPLQAPGPTYLYLMSRLPWISCAVSLVR